jgi:UDP-N-acetylglucosamine/UDP-N-acetylgalactosamine diphosphorylase
LLESKSSIAMSPDGHGGSLRALQRSGALDLMEKEGIDTISYFQVDNPLVRSIDPAFIGWHLQRNSEMSSKMIPKAYAEESWAISARKTITWWLSSTRISHGVAARD